MRTFCVPWILLLLGLFLKAGVGERTIIVLGDSASDNGQGYAKTVKQVLRTDSVFPQAPYFSGRWTNGPTWIEHAAKIMGSKLINVASGGATSGTVVSKLAPLPSGFASLTEPTFIVPNNLYQQVDQMLLETNGSTPSDAVYILCIGANDLLSRIFGNTSVTGKAVASHVESVATDLFNRGARQFVFVTLPSFEALPLWHKPEEFGAFDLEALDNSLQAIAEYNSLLSQLADRFSDSNEGTSAHVYSIADGMMRVLANPGYGLTNFEDPCYMPPHVPENSAPYDHPWGLGGGTVCSDPASHVFWDAIHGSAALHEAVGADFINTLSEPVFGRAVHVPGPEATSKPSATHVEL